MHLYIYLQCDLRFSTLSFLYPTWFFFFFGTISPHTLHHHITTPLFRRHPALHGGRLPGDAGDPRAAVPGLRPEADSVVCVRWPLRQLHPGVRQQDLADGAVLHVLPGVGRARGVRVALLPQGQKWREEV